MNPSTSLLIATYNSPDRLQLVLESVTRLDPQPTEIVVCDDGSTDQTRQVVEGFREVSPTKILHSYQPDAGWRVSRSRNLGMSRSTGDYLIFLDGDCLVQPRFIADHLAIAQKRQIAFGDRVHIAPEMAPYVADGLLGKLRLLISTGRVRKRRCILPLTAPRPQTRTKQTTQSIDDIPFVIGCNMGCYKHDFLELGGFDEDLGGTWGGEDVDLALRALNLGMQLRGVSRSAVVFHMDHEVKIGNDFATMYQAIDTRYRSGSTGPRQSLFRNATGLPTSEERG